jgi:hypothetical protein
MVSIEDYQKWQRLAKEQVFSMVEPVQKRNEHVATAELERDVRESLKTLRQERRLRKSSQK